MKAAIYNPYLDTLGGGERYAMSFARVLKDAGYRVDVGWKDLEIKEKLEDRFGMELDDLNVVPDIKRGDGYDICFWLSDGSIPLLRARKNILHFQIPFKNINGKTLLNRMKLYRINRIICNSYFTKSYVDNEYGVKSEVIYPPVEIGTIKPKKKENLIISVGRFSQLMQAKKQDVLVSAFKKFYDAGFKNWQLILAGGVEIGVNDYVGKLEENSKGYPIQIIKSPSWKMLKDLYGKAKMFWSASGYKVDEKKEPEKVEHFGITVVEAMAAGAIPLIYDAGGHKEIISEGENGYLWINIKTLLQKTQEIAKNKQFQIKLSKNAYISSKVYEYERFEAQVLEIL